jgi:hypothetical protein
MRRTLIGLATATILAVPLITLTAVPAGSASTSDPYCFQSSTGRYIGSAPSGSQVPMNTDCIVEFARINYEDIGGVGYYEYEAVTGPNVDLCLKEG